MPSANGTGAAHATIKEEGRERERRREREAEALSSLFKAVSLSPRPIPGAGLVVETGPKASPHCSVLLASAGHGNSGGPRPGLRRQGLLCRRPVASKPKAEPEAASEPRPRCRAAAPRSSCSPCRKARPGFAQRCLPTSADVHQDAGDTLFQPRGRGFGFFRLQLALVFFRCPSQASFHMGYMTGSALSLSLFLSLSLSLCPANRLIPMLPRTCCMNLPWSPNTKAS